MSRNNNIRQALSNLMLRALSHSSLKLTQTKTVRRDGVLRRDCVRFWMQPQQFTGVVDTFVSSHPTIAALVWGGVKTTILVASNVTSYLEKVTNMIMMVGKSSPTYQQFGQLYPGCVGLQRALCDYYTIIIRLFIRIIEVSRRTTIIQTFSSTLKPFEVEFKSPLDDLDKTVKDIH